MTVHLSAENSKDPLSIWFCVAGNLLHSLKFLAKASSKHTKNDTLFIILVKRISSHSQNGLISLHGKYRYISNG